ncbi:MAG: hypothetical protein NTU44_07150 [Bacteroidetes bacterium]|nr:hypothetical protein [Bacteroidota bacterium]
MSKRVVRSLFFLSFLFAGLLTDAQKPLSSPYSRYGIGDIFRPTNNQTMSMGGAGIALRSPMFVNFANPASYTAFDTLTFVFEGAVVSNTQTLKTQDLSQKANFTTLKSLVFGFPVASWWKASMGILPYSQVGYKVGDVQVVDNVGKVKINYEGDGGFNQVYMGHGFKLSKNVSVGVNISYLFGTISRQRALTFPDSTYIRYFKVEDEISVSDFLLTYGVQYHKTLGNGMLFNAGATYSASTPLKSRESVLSVTYNEGSTGIVYVKDTIELQPSIKGTIVVPSSFGLGVALENPEKWLLAADFKTQNWKKFKIFGEQDSLKNSMEADLGFQFIPNNNSLSSYLQKVNYRVGIRYAKTYLQLHSRQLDEIGFTFGFGLPLARTKSRVNLGFELGRRGTTSDHLIQNNYFMVTLGVSVFENWFYRRKFE